MSLAMRLDRKVKARAWRALKASLASNADVNTEPLVNAQPLRCSSPPAPEMTGFPTSEEEFTRIYSAFDIVGFYSSFHYKDIFVSRFWTFHVLATSSSFLHSSVFLFKLLRSSQGRLCPACCLKIRIEIVGHHQATASLCHKRTLAILFPFSQSVRSWVLQQPKDQ